MIHILTHIQKPLPDIPEPEKLRQSKRSSKGYKPQKLICARSIRNRLKY